MTRSMSWSIPYCGRRAFQIFRLGLEPHRVVERKIAEGPNPWLRVAMNQSGPGNYGVNENQSDG